MRRQFLCVAAILLASIASVQADITSWDAYTEFNSATNTSSDTWQYMGGVFGANSGYWLLPNYAVFPYESFNGWQNGGGNFPAVGISAGEVKVHPEMPGSGSAAVIGWKSPMTGKVDVSFSLADRDNGVSADGMDYALFQQGSATALAWANVPNAGDSGLVHVSGLSVTTGSMLYLQIGPGTTNHWYDLGGVSFIVTEAVPEPSAIVLFGCGLISLLAYAWRKHK